WEKGHNKLQEAGQLYQKAKDEAAIVRAALAKRDEAVAVLPYLARWVSSQWLRSKDEKGKDQVRQWTTQVEQISTAAGALVDQLQAPRLGDGAQDLERLPKLTKALHDDLQSLRKAFF